MILRVNITLQYPLQPPTSHPSTMGTTCPCSSVATTRKYLCRDAQTVVVVVGLVVVAGVFGAAAVMLLCLCFQFVF